MKRDAARRAAASAALVGLIALAVHVAVLVTLPSDPLTDTLVSDALSYDQWARRLATDGWAAEPVFHQSPGYPVALSVVYGSDPGPGVPTRVWWLQALATSLALGSVVWLGAAYLRSTRAGVYGAVLATLFGPIVFHGVKLLPVSLALASQAVALTFLALYRRSPGAASAAAVGAACGVACVTRAEFLLFLPIAVTAIAVCAPPGRRTLHAGLALCGWMLLVAPVTAHNVARGDRVLIASSAGENLFAGNRRGADGAHAAIDPRAGDLFSSRLLASQLASTDLGRDASPSEVSAYWRGRAVRDVLDDPGEWIVLEFRKLGRALHPGDPTDLYSFPLERDLYLPALHLLPVPAAVVVVLGAIGVIVAWRTCRPTAWPLLAYVTVQLVVLLAFFVSSRLRMPLLFGLTPFGGLAIAWTVDRWRDPAHRRVAIAVVVGVAVAAVVGTVATRPSPRDRVRLAAVLSTRGELDESLAVLAPALAGPSPDALALDQAGWVSSKRGDVDVAIGRYVAALEIGLPPGREASTRMRLARLRASRGDRDGAVEDLRRAIELEPQWDEPRRALAELGYRVP